MTGKLAEPALRRVAEEIAASSGGGGGGGKVEPVVVPLNIQVAALMTAEWVARKLELPRGEKVDRVVLPGYCRGDLAPIERKLGVPVVAGPTDLHDLPEMFGKKRRDAVDLSAFSIEIIAEINHAARLPIEQILAMADAYRADGADVIDVGCDPQADRPAWAGVADVVRELRARGFRVSIDSFHPVEIEAATAAGAELVLSVNAANAKTCEVHGAEVVVIPDDPRNPRYLSGLDKTLRTLDRRGIRHRIDPVIEPIGFGFAASLGRYLEVRRRFPAAAMMMGIGNLTEMTEVDSAGVNALLIGFCEELSIRSVLTTQVINWARSSIKEIDLARRLMHHAVSRQTAPKHLDRRLVMLRDPKLRNTLPEELETLARGLKDRNIRIFADPASGGRGRIHAMNKDFHAVGDDPFVLFDQLPPEVRADGSHAFYLGFEMAKALTALTLHKNYTQDQALDWGLLTREEISHHERRKAGKRESGKAGNEGGPA